MVQLKALTTFLIATTLVLPSLAVPVITYDSEDLLAYVAFAPGAYIHSLSLKS
jgi:hypothetical protein